ncbi:PQQ-dependent sugar dehydrogenase [Neptuniibacter sp. QD48_55]|uniref:PQQ-dependent sugar dehydrogenase n=1 Tax=Neptuniibacter sp. QD48_55 TaxID=3398212 RepID=UPI0039F49325
MRTFNLPKQTILGVVFTAIAGLSLSFSASAATNLNTKIIAQGIEYPWGMTWISDHELLITEKEVGGWMVDTNTGKKQKVTGWPEDINPDGQGGLLDVISDPLFASNRKLYLSFSHQDRSKGSTTRVASAELSPDLELVNWTVLFTALPYSGKVHHYGSRLALADDNLYISVGDRGQRHRSQDLSDHAGKIHRINKDGSTPKNNPFIGMTEKSGKPIPESIYSYGHRNPQGMFIDSQSNIWIHEHGPRGGDELNLVQKGKNYGWPIITYGKEYWGPSIGEGTHKQGMQQPEYYYVPSIAPSGLIRYEADLFKEWQGDFLIGALKGSHLNRLTKGSGTSETNQKFEEHRYLEDLDVRIRDLEVDKQGAIYLLTDEGNGRLIKVTP